MKKAIGQRRLYGRQAERVLVISMGSEELLGRVCASQRRKLTKTEWRSKTRKRAEEYSMEQKRHTVHDSVQQGWITDLDEFKNLKGKSYTSGVAIALIDGFGGLVRIKK